MEQSLGLVEVKGLCSAIETADVMVKAANVTLVELEAARGSGMMTIKVIGDVGAVKAAVEAGRAQALTDGSLVSVDVIARPTKALGDVFIRYPGKKEKPNFYGVEEKPPVPEKAAETAAPVAEEKIEVVAAQEPVVEAATEAAPAQVEAVSAVPETSADGETSAEPANTPAPKTRRPRRATRVRRTKSSKTKKTTTEPSEE